VPLSDYAHHNEEAHQIWWQEEGKHHDADYETHVADDDDRFDFADDDESNCTCTYGSYLVHGGGTDWGIVKYDTNCPEHG
jgi:hypothetical protein